MLLLTIPPTLESPGEPQQGPLRLEGVGVTFGPGVNALADDGVAAQPFRPLLSGSLRLAGGIPKGARWRLWKLDVRHLPALRKGAPLRASMGMALDARWKPGTEAAEELSFEAPWPGGRVEAGDRVVVECRVRGRRRALAASAVQSRLLHAGPGVRPPD